MSADERPHLSWAKFREDLSLSARVMRERPRLTWWTLGFALAVETPILLQRLTGNGIYELMVLFEIATAGFYGTQRIWFLRAFAGGDLRSGEAVKITRAMLARFLVLGCVVIIPFTLVFVLIYRAGTVGIVGSTLVLVAEDVLLTFTVPALSYTTNRAVEAVSIGWQMLRDEWPRCAWYALTPPLAVVALLRLPLATLPAGLVFVLAVTDFMVSLWLKGAIAAYYLRLTPTKPNGAL